MRHPLRRFAMIATIEPIFAFFPVKNELPHAAGRSVVIMAGGVNRLRWVGG
jgi:hypothetical protein